jgi:AsmA protein
LCEGKVTGNIRVDARKKEPKIEINNSLTGIQINPLLSDFSGNEKLSGRGSANVALQMNRLGALRIKETLNASIDVNLNDGADKGLDAIKTICSAGRKL